MLFKLSSLYAAAIVIGVCAQEKLHKSEDGSNFYVEFELKYNWYQAWNECARRNMSLIAVDSLEKHLQIDGLLKKLLSYSPKVWLDGHDNAVDRRYEWAATGQEFSFTNWGPSQPDCLNNNEHCILIWDYHWKWFDLPCSHPLGFICIDVPIAKAKVNQLNDVKTSSSLVESTKNRNIFIFNTFY